MHRTLSVGTSSTKRRIHESATGSAKLFADAAREEAEDQTTTKRTIDTTSLIASEHANWTGEESTRDAVLRMLVDKYKPLRTGTLRSAEEKLKEALPQPTSNTPKTTFGQWVNEPLLPSVEGHRPWHTKFKPPSTQTASVRLGQFTSIRPRVAKSNDRENSGNAARETKQKSQTIERLVKARESTLDYRLGIQSSSTSRGRSNPVSLKGWTNMIEDKIERARKAGFFNAVEGRGKPLVTQHDERNPFIPPEEYLLNRIVQRNGAVPPWIEVQHELESELASFRQILRQTWTRRVVRTLTSQHSVTKLKTFNLADIQSYRDKEWEERERSFHDVLLTDLNNLIRKYNALAPYVVRRPYHTRQVELQKMFQDNAEDVFKKLVEKIDAAPGSETQRATPPDIDLNDVHLHKPFPPDRPFSIFEAVRRWWMRLMVR